MAVQTLLGLVALLALPGAATVCVAQEVAGPPSVALHWARGPGAERCIGPSELVAALEERFGPTFVNPARASQVLEGSVSTSAEGYVVLLRVMDDHGQVRGERRFVSSEPDCVSLRRQLLLVISLLLDPEGRWDVRLPSLFGEPTEDPKERLLAEIEESERAPVPQREESKVETRAPASEPMPAPRLPALLALDALAGVGSDRRPSLGLRLRLDVPVNTHWMLETGAVADLPRNHRIQGDATLRTQVVAGWFGACPRAWGQTLSFTGCAGASAGAQRLESHGLLGATAPDWSLALGAWLDFRFGWHVSSGAGLAWGALVYLPITQGKPTYEAPGEPPRTVFDPLYMSGWAYLSGFVSL